LNLEEDIEAEDCISSVASDDEKLFELTCLELANKNSRRILKEIASGRGTASEIAAQTGLSSQDVLIHLTRLESIGLIQKDSLISDSLRGRNPKHYKISKLAVVLIPTEIIDKVSLRQFISKKSFELLKKRIFTSGVIASVWVISLVAAYYLVNRISALVQAGSAISVNFSEVFTLILALSTAGVFAVTWKLAKRQSKKEIDKSEKSARRVLNLS